MKQWHKRCSNNDTLIFSKRKYFLPTLEIKEYNVLIDGRNFFDKPLKNYLSTYDNIQKLQFIKVTITKLGVLLDQPYVENYYKLTAINLSKQQKLDADPKPIH